MTKKENTKVEEIEHKAKRGGRTMPTRDNLYARIANHVPTAIDKAVALLESNNEAIRLGAIKFLVDKALPDLKAMEITGEDHGPLIIRIVEDTKNNNNE